MNTSVPQRNQMIARTVTVAFPENFLRRRVLMALLMLALSLFFYASLQAQSATEIITDFNGLWKSSTTSKSSVKPDNSHNMLAFTYNGTRYSTGVNDAKLTATGNTFVAGDYKALPVYAITGSNKTDTKIGLGAKYDGVENGPGNPRPENNINKYLTDGVKGLDLGTCVANLPAGEIMFSISNLRSQMIGDGVPDLLITQVADPSSSYDKYEFTDVNGNKVGNTVDINLSTLSVLGSWTADFYNVNSTPMGLDAGFTKTDRDLRLWAADFSAFGINSSNISRIAYFRVRLSGSSDIAFVAYNNQTVSLGAILPVKMNFFKGYAAQQQVTLNWQTAMEQETNRFVIESSYDGVTFYAIDSVKAAGQSFGAKNYTYTQRNPRNGKIYYRLKQVDNNARYEYSSIVVVNSENDAYRAVNMYPNPVVSTLTIKHQPATGQEQCTIRNMQGVAMAQKTLAAGSIQSSFDMQQLPTGTYMVVIANGKEQFTEMVVKK